MFSESASAGVAGSSEVLVPAIRLKAGREKSVLNRHPWVYSGAIADTEGGPQPGDIIDIRAHAGEWLGRGYYNPQSQIVVRILTWDPSQAIDSDFWRHRLQAALARRRALLQDPTTTAFRLVHAESDGLPGLIVDCYGDWLVIQSLTLGIERHKALLVETLVELLQPEGIFERSDVHVRSLEGLSEVEGCLHGELSDGPIVVLENGLSFFVDLVSGHKTGFYLDQRENRRKVAEYCNGQSVLNAFSYTGGFAVYAGRQGAGRVTSVDTSSDALQMAEENVKINGLSPGDHEYVNGDAFQVLRRLRDGAREFDVVILDPPKFALARSQLNAATRGYKDINMLGMRLLRPGGILCTFSCSGALSEDLFQKVLFGASVDVGRDVRVIERMGQGRDHPVLLSFPQSAYLKGFACRVE